MMISGVWHTDRRNHSANEVGVKKHKKDGSGFKEIFDSELEKTKGDTDDSE